MGKRVYAFLSAFIIAAPALWSMSTANAQGEEVIHLSDAAVFTAEVVGINKEDRALTLREPTAMSPNSWWGKRQEISTRSGSAID